MRLLLVGHELDRATEIGLHEEFADGGQGRRVVVDPAEQDDEPVALDGAQRVGAVGPGDPADVLEQVGLAASPRHGADHHQHALLSRPAQGAGPAEHGLVGLGTQDGVDDQRLQPRVPGAAGLGGPRVDLGGGEGDLAGVAGQGTADVGGPLGVEQGIDVRVDGLEGASGPSLSRTVTVSTRYNNPQMIARILVNGPELQFL